MLHQHLLDTQGLYCPEPVMMLHSKIDEMQSGDVVKVIASDPATQRDIPKFCQFLGHELLDQSQE
ncbi:sulfurtransferase TusA, partial [Oleiphilus sp. HI0123]